ncbi:peptidoglycan DD-metalloendopeptidase family protein [Enterococcus casseliflavus]|nr:phage tail spike protein [Enterococcus casseliflavus]MBE9898653.1 peptidoglycan DD-metalloendopeptidase family protein [Enterococcus casseliflavus]MBE9901939.1 peptidoglycan DD-metalloendopeptidase family protein [Enterococcus casseliflavus]MBE9922346.1 peptidoglycan DD-metalloendopeptidase family protein [Enterococcus casseliflavus]
MKPRIYEPTEKDFSHNGLGIMIDTTRCDVTEQANGKYEVEIEHPLISRFANYFENGYQIKAKPNDQEEYHIFEIKNTYKDTIGNTILIYGQSRTYKLGNREVQHVAIDSKNGAEAMAAIENGMDEPSDVKLFSDIQTTSSTVFEARNVLGCIAGEQGGMLQYWGGEIKREPFKLSLLRRRGRDNVGTVRYGKDLNGLKIKFDWSSIVTKVLPYADLQNSDDGTTKRIYGNAVLSDLATNYPDVYSKHIQFTEEQGVKDLASLNRVAANYFKSINPGSDKPKISIELEVEKLTDSEEAKEFAKIRNYGLFDTFSVYHKLYDIHIETKINSVVYDSLTEKNKKIYAGDAQMAFYTKQSYELQETIKTLTKKGYMSEFVDYVTNLINGVEGGSVLQYPKNKPHTTYYMDTDSRDTAKDVIAINNQGLGFSRTGWLGPFVDAWSIDGTLNADFIRAGKIRTNIMEVSFNGMGDLLRMVSGTLQLWNGDLKIMELTKKGLQFWSGEKSLGTIGTAGEPFPDLVDQDDPVSMDGKALMIRGDADNDYIALSAKTGTGIILGNGKGLYLIDDNIRIIGDITLSGNLDVRGDLKINGQQVYPGGSGGGVGPSGSTYDPINIGSNITGNANIVAWLEKYTKLYGIFGYIGLAYALIMVENPSTDGTDDIMQSSESAGYPGPGYLTGEASVKQGCKHLAEQIKNGQDQNVDIWGVMQGYNFGSAYIPWLANKGGKNTTDLAEVYSRDVVAPSLGNTTGATYSYVNAVSQADGRTYLYLNGGNFHYAAMIRQYVQVNESTGYVVPISKPVTVTSEFGYRTHPITGAYSLHNGIDLVNGNATTPIFAAAAGEVVIAGSYPDWYGNYVVIKHADGLYTGYAHQSQLRVSVGDTVNQGQQIGNMGTTGPSTGPHLHFQFFTNGPWPSSDDFINPREHIDF